MEIREILAFNLRKLRQARHLSQEELMLRESTGPISVRLSEAFTPPASMSWTVLPTRSVSKLQIFSNGRRRLAERRKRVAAPAILELKSMPKVGQCFLASRATGPTSRGRSGRSYTIQLRSV